MSTEQTINAIIGCFLAIIGILLTLWGSKLPGKVVNVRIGFGVPIGGVGIFMLSLARPEFGSALTVIATLILAFAAFWSVKRTIDYQNQFRNEDRDSDFRRRSLNEIVQWLKDIQEHTTAPEGSNVLGKLGVLYKSHVLVASGVWVKETATIFGEAFLSKIDKVVNNFGDCDKYLTQIWDEASENDVDKLMEMSKVLMASVDEAMKYAIKLKIEQKL